MLMCTAQRCTYVSLPPLTIQAQKALLQALGRAVWVGALLRLTEIEAGEILIDSIDVRTVAPCTSALRCWLCPAVNFSV